MHIHNSTTNGKPTASPAHLSRGHIHSHEQHGQHEQHEQQQQQQQPQQGPQAREDLTTRQLLLLTCGLIGIQFCWAVQVGYVTKSLLELGLSQRYVSYAWLAGPIAGILIQPIVGALSDKCTHPLGRRRPFLITGSLFSAVCLLLFAYAEPIGLLFGDNATSHFFALSLSILSFWLLDFSINAAQGPLRALLADVVPAKQHQQGNSFFALATGIGNLSGSLLGSVQLSKFLPLFQNDLQALYSITACVLLVTMGCTVISTEEIPLNPVSSASSTSSSSSYDSVNRNEGDQQLLDDRDDDQQQPTQQHAQNNNSNDHDNTDMDDDSPNEPISFIQAGLNAPYPFWHTFLVQCFTWFGWFTLFVFATSWMGSEVYKGSFDAQPDTPERARYDAGVRLGNLGLGLQSIITMIVAPILPSIIDKVGAQTVYLTANLSFALCLLATQVVQSGLMGCILLAATGINWAVTMTVPWSLMGESVAKHRPYAVGVYYTMFNLSQCFPEVVVSVVAEEVIRFSGNQTSVLVLGGFMVLIGSVCILCLGVGKKHGAEYQDEDQQRIIDGGSRHQV